MLSQIKTQESGKKNIFRLKKIAKKASPMFLNVKVVAGKK